MWGSDWRNHCGQPKVPPGTNPEPFLEEPGLEPEFVFVEKVPAGTKHGSSWNHCWVPLAPFSFPLLSSPPASDGPSISTRNLPESPTGLYPSSTQDTVRSPVSVATTALPLNLLYHHSEYRRPEDHQGPSSLHQPSDPGAGPGTISPALQGRRSGLDEKDTTPPTGQSPGESPPSLA